MTAKQLWIIGGVVLLTALSSCGVSDRGELIGVQGRRPWFHRQPYGMVYVPSGTYHMGQSDQDILYALTNRPRQVSIHGFYMDATEITNNEYRQFVYWVRDSIAHKLLAGDHLENEGEDNEHINWRARIDWQDMEVQDMLADMAYQGKDKLTGGFELNISKLIYRYKWYDMHEAAKLENKLNPKPRSTFIREEAVAVYPDTLCWIRDFSYSFNDPMAVAYFFHPAYDDYPVVGVNWKQAQAFCHWRTEYLNSWLRKYGEPTLVPFRLPTEAEWEYAAHGGRHHNPYPWGGPYLRNSKGCFLANFKPLRGNYTEDGGFYPVRADKYFPNDYGLYNMAGNVAEWTSTAYDEVLNAYLDDLNPYYYYDAKDDDPMTKKRKVIKGGSWKDVGYFLQIPSRAYEYQDTAKSYIGFRCVMTFMGRSINDF